MLIDTIILNPKKSVKTTILSVAVLTLSTLTLSGCNSDDSSSGSAAQTIPVETQGTQPTANSINQAPIAVDNVVTLQSNETITITLVATDNENSPLTYTIENSPENGEISQNDNIVIYTTNNNFIGSDSFTFIANDGDDNSNSATISIEVLAPSLTTTLLDGSIVDTTMLVNLGNLLYHDTNLSNPIGQSCASCHDLNTGFDDPNAANPTSVGADGTSFGTRNSPTASYSAHIPTPPPPCSW